MGKLILLSTPLGNVGDLTERVKKAFIEGEMFVVEDTRSFKALLQHLEIDYSSKVFLSFHDHSGEAGLDKMLRLLTEGHTLFCASEAGSPVLSDPFYPLVNRALEAGHLVDSFPGASSPIMALELSGLPPTPFLFLGFLPREKNKILSFLQHAINHTPTVIFFESPQRLHNTLDLLTSNIEAEFFVGRELTKKFQSCYRFSSKNWPHTKKTLLEKGEMVVIMHRPLSHQQTELRTRNESQVQALAEMVLEKKGRTKDLSKLLALLLNQSSDIIYKKLLERES